MTIDERALQAAHRAFVRDDETVSMDIIMRVRPAIEAYEAALWRPIVEAPENGKVLIHLPDCGPDAVWTATRADGTDWLLDEYGEAPELSQEDLVKRNAMFCKIPLLIPTPTKKDW